MNCITRHSLLTLALILHVVGNAATSPLLIDGGTYHLGTPGFPEWAQFEGRTPHGRRLDLPFNATANDAEHTLFLRQRDVKQSWQVQINGRRLGTLINIESELVSTFAIPPGVLRNGSNTLSIVPPNATDDILVSDFRIDPRPRDQAVGIATLAINVTDADGKAGLPCRITITDAAGVLVPLIAAPGQQLALRTGVVYTRDGRANLSLPPGDLVIYAGRGFEWSVDQRRVSIAAGERKSVALQIRREVPTPGWVAVDSHIHTLTHSGHGDATIDERMLTIAGEGIELAIATDHNHHTDYAEAAARTQLTRRFTPVVGNEVTTKAGHFNAFPITPGAAVADAKITAWPDLLRAIRATPGVQVVQLNHPRDLHSGFVPFGPTNFNDITGEHRMDAQFGIDAIEVITSAAMQSDVMRLFHDWFALLNRGHRVAAIASSDTHDVSRFILGQGRTYVACRNDDPSSLDLDEIWRSYREGRVRVSFGLLAGLQMEDSGNAGASKGVLRVTATVHGPSWVTADRVELFANGIKVREQKIQPGTNVLKAAVTWELPRPAYDQHLVANATGPGITKPFWETPRPYQPSSPEFNPRVLGATQAFWMDGDRDGRISSARDYAVKAVQQHGTDPARLFRALAGYDEAVAIQAAAQLHASGNDVREPRWTTALQSATPAVQRGFAAHARSLAVRVRGN